MYIFPKQGSLEIEQPISYSKILKNKYSLTKNLSNCMQTTFTLGAAKRTEKVQKACKINQCKSFVKICFTAENLLDKPSTHNEKVAFFKCSSFGIIEEHSSPNHSDVFSYETKGDEVIVRAHKGYILGPAIAGYK